MTRTKEIGGEGSEVSENIPKTTKNRLNINDGERLRREVAGDPKIIFVLLVI